jgi:hypothetical protein
VPTVRVGVADLAEQEFGIGWLRRRQQFGAADAK